MSSTKLFQQIKTNLARESSARLATIVQDTECEQWSPDAIAAARDLLNERAAGLQIEPESTTINDDESEPHTLDLSRGLRTHFDHSSHAKAVLKRLQTYLPPVASAYQPSGKMPAGTVWKMSVAAARGVIYGICTFITTAALFLICWVGIDALANTQVGTNATLLSFLLGIFLVVVQAVVLGSAYPAIGLAVATPLENINKQVKNRNSSMLILLAAFAATIAVTAVWGLASLEPIQQLWEPALKESFADARSPWARLLFVDHFREFQFVGLGLTIWVSCGLVWRLCHEAKFCEACDCYMQEFRLAHLNAGDTDSAARLVSGRDFPTLCRQLRQWDRNATHLNGNLKLHSCPSCSTGFLDLVFHYAATYDRKSKYSPTFLEEEWIIASATLTRELTFALQEAANFAETCDKHSNDSYSIPM